MQRLDRQLIQSILLIYLLILGVVTLSATLSQAARLTDEVLARGMGLESFGLLLLTLMPKMAELVTPLAFGIAVVLACVQRNEARTTLLLRAAGRSPARDTALVALAGLALALTLAATASTVIPASQILYRTLLGQAQQQGLERFDLPLGQPFMLDDVYTLRIQQQAGDGRFTGVSLVEHRPEQGRTRILHAQEARLTLLSEETGAAVLSLEQGSLIEWGTGAEVQQAISFDQSQVPLTLPRAQPLRVLDRVDTGSTTKLWRQRSDQAAAEELTRRLAMVVSILSFAVLASGALFSRSALPAGQTGLAVFLVTFLILFLMLQASLLSVPGFGLPLGVIVLFIALSPLSVLPIIRFGQGATA